MQLHVPKHFTDDMMQHQLSSYLIERVEFFYPQMVDYLKSKKLTFTSYVIGVYNGCVWADEFLIGAIGMMYNVWITVVSPYFSDVWNIFHDGRAQPDIDIKQEMKEEIIPDEHTPTPMTSNHQELDASQQHSEPNTIQGKLSKILPTQKPDELQVHIPQSSTSVSALRYKPRQKKVDRTSVTVHKQIDEMTIQGPIPKKDQLDDMFYCDKCPKSFKDKAYCRKHMTRLCPALTDIQCLKCPHCDKMYRHDKNYREHLSIHDGIKRFKCGKCGEKFFTDMQVLKHRTLCCAKK